MALTTERGPTVPSLIALAGVVVACGLVTQAMAQEPSDSWEARGSIRQMERLSAHEGWVLTDQALLFTEDGGASWTDMASSERLDGVTDAFFLSNSRGWLAGIDSDSPDRLRLLGTANGATWREQVVESSALAFEHYASAQVHFVDAAHGWLLGKVATSAAFSVGELLRTTDGGATWERLPRPLAAGRIVFIDAQRGFMTGAPVSERLYRTVDGGRSWQELSLPVPAAPGMALYDLPTFGSPNLGTVAVTVRGDSPRLLTFVTRDGGRRWSPAHSLVLAGEDYSEPVPAALTVNGGVQAFAARGSVTLATDSSPQVVSLAREDGSLPAPSGAGAVSVQSLSLTEESSGWALVAEGGCDEGVCRQVTRLVALDESGQAFVAAGADLLVRTEEEVMPLDSELAASGAVISFDKGFDQCAAGTTSQMQTWKTFSPYKDANIYYGGAARGCSQVNLNASWVSTVFDQGWRLIPTWVGPQAPCTGYSTRFSSNPATAAAQGQAEADKAVDAAAALGLGAGTPLYYDLELYAENDASCSAGVRAFVDAWSAQVRDRGYLAGVYGNARNAQADWRPGVIANPPDAVWLVPWVCNRGTTSCNWEPTVFGIPGLNDAYWANNQRIRQYWGDHHETYGGVTFNIDSDYANGPVAGPGTPSSCQTSVAAGHWKGEYFNNMSLNGSPVMVRDDGSGSLDFDWGSGSPGSSCGVPADHFSVRWTRTTFFNAGIYEFTITSDDGFRLYVDGVLQMQAWIDQGPTTYTKQVSLSAGNHSITVEYYENGGGAVAKVSWKLSSNCFTSVPSTSWKGEYFLNKNLSGSPAMIRNDGTGFLNFEWYSSSPSSACAFPADNFSVRWTRSVYFSAGTYRFDVTSDDGFRLYVDGVVKLEAWIDQGPTAYSVNVPLSAGYHSVKMEYYENGGWAVAKLSWTVAPVQAVLRQVVWRGGLGYMRIVPFLPDGSNPDWPRASAWSVHSAASLPGSGTIQTWDAYAMQSGLLESFWRGNQGYFRIVPWGSSGHPHYGAAPGWSGPIAISALPGSGSIHAQDSFRPGNVMWQSFWRGNQGWFRTVPVTAAGAPIWSQAGAWSGPLGVGGLPGTGSIQSQSGETYPGNSMLLQSIWRNNFGYYRTVPIDSAGNVIWSQAHPWSAPIPISALPGSGDIQAQAGAVYHIAP